MSEVMPPAERAAAPGRRGRSAGRWVALALVALAAVLLVVWVARHHAATPSAAAGTGRGAGNGAGPVTVTTVTAQAGDIGVYVNALGAVTPLNQVSVNSRVEGQIVKISYQEGQMVRVGDPLLEIDPGPNQAALTQAEGQLERDTALLTNARLDLQRYQAAFASNAIPEQQLDTQTATVQQYEGTVRLDQGLLDNAKVQLAYCYITAPLAGRVGLRLVDQGNMVQAGGANLLTITQLQPISVIFDVAEDYLPQIQAQLRAGRQLAVDVFDRDQQRQLASGWLETLDNQIDPATGTVQLRAIFTNADEALFPNQFVNARLRVTTLRQVVTLPNTVIQRNADSAFVYVVAAADATAGSPDGAPSSRPAVQLQSITVGATDGTVSQVTGLAAGTVVVADNFNKLTDGMRVTVRAGSDTAGAGAGARAGRRSQAAAAP